MNIVISLNSKIIENKKMLTDKRKQDYETNVFKRMIRKYPKYKLLVKKYISTHQS